MTRRWLVALLAVFVALHVSAQRNKRDAKMPKAAYKGEVGESPVGAIPDAELHDNDRNKDVRITIEYPTRSGNNPLIVFSPGYGGDNNAYVGLSSYWASQGYIVIRVAHADAGKIANADIWTTLTQTDHRNRVRDITFVLDSLDLLEQRYEELKGKIDRTKIVAAGHSYGAYTAMLLGGMRIYPGPVGYADPRIKAVIAMSPQGPSETRGLTKESWSEMKVPVLFMTGTRDQGIADIETPEWRRQAFDNAAAGDKWLVVIEHARHATFVGRYDAFIAAQARESEPTPERVKIPGELPGDQRNPSTTPARLPGSSANAAAVRERDLFVTIKSMALAFLDAYEKEDAKGREALEKAGTSGGVEVQRK